MQYYSFNASFLLQNDYCSQIIVLMCVELIVIFYILVMLLSNICQKV